ncbi:hypothetical protein BUALT_Bualt13G0001800 [Buddleja alternifolia]|uniref:Uncharacterized protein n=1 Tax=Buddleja alternifolia TaxID=168488 RepID=A0AAV6WUB3_9LAMI|nr:hypothetical protein BUALT_Bualt13G0001800 [Buddleja alternifolia]
MCRCIAYRIKFLSLCNLIKGLLRCGKSCRLRWINYLRSDLKRGNITAAEEDIIINLHATMGNRWSLIAGYLPGRTDNEIKNYWNSHLSRKIQSFRRLIPNFIPPPLPPDSSSSSATVKTNKQTGGKTKKKKNKNSNNRKNTTPPKPPVILLCEQDQQITEEEDEVRINGGVEIMPTTPSPEKEELLSSSGSSHAHVEWQEKRININVFINSSSPPAEEGMGTVAGADQTEEIENRRRSLMLSNNSNNGMGSSGILCLDDMMADLNDFWSMEQEEEEDCLGITHTHDQELGTGIIINNNNNNIPGLLDNGGEFELDQLMRSPGPAGNNLWEWNWGQEENTTSMSSSSSWLWDSEKLGGGGGGDLERSFEMAEEDEKQNAILLSWFLS